ncbi:MAG: serine hydrolase, partial [Acidobacteriia bacterium]|nr:serine hydrolase [Terriglobia bacterium]
FRKAYGYRSLEPRRETMTLDTIFDMASLTKCMATAVAVMQLVQDGQVRLNDPVARYIPAFSANGKQDITVRQLLTHYSGLPEDLDLKQPWHGRDAAFRMAMDETPEYTPGSRFFYSDVNYEVLGFLVERVSGMALEKYASVHIFQPLKMAETTYLPPASWRPRIAPTEYDEGGHMLRGVVHDPTARRMGGVAGHAGVFSTANDLAKFAQAMLDGGAPVLSPLMVEKMTTPQQPPNATSVRGFGWDIDTAFSSNRGELLPVGSFGHTGYTGTSLWMDPVTRTYIIILANAVHPRGQNGAMVSLRNRTATAVTAALKLSASEEERMRLARITGYNDSLAASRRINVRNGQVKTGIDVLELHNFDRLRAPEPGKIRRIGLLTNQTGVDGLGRRTIDVLAHVDGIKLAAILSPEHGVTGALDTTSVGNTVDAATGVPVYSVYGDTDAKRRPPLDIMKDLDAVVYDIQDAGARFYTYETTLGYLLEAAAKTGTEVIVLDRPNPVTGSYVQGPVSQPGQESFVNYTQARLDSRRLVRLHRTGVDQPIAESAQPDAGDALYRSGGDRRHECLGGTRNRHAIRGGGRAVDQAERICGLPERARHPGRALCAHQFHAGGGAEVWRAEDRRGEHRAARSQHSGRAGVGSGTGVGPAQAVSQRVRHAADDSAGQRSACHERDCRRRRSAQHRRRLARRTGEI